MSEWLLRTLGRRMPAWLLLLALLGAALVRLVVLVFSRWWLLWPLLVAVLVWRFGTVTVGAVAGGVVLTAVVSLVGWSMLAPDSWQARVGDPVRGVLRTRTYRRAWDDAMDGCGLVRGGIVPTLMACRTTGGVDRISVRMAPGQVAADWRDIAPRIAGALGVRSVRVRADGPRDVTLLVRWREIRYRDVTTAPEIEAEVDEVTEQLARERELEQLDTPDVPAPAEIRGAFPRSPR